MIYSIQKYLSALIHLHYGRPKRFLWLNRFTIIPELIHNTYILNQFSDNIMIRFMITSPHINSCVCFLSIRLNCSFDESTSVDSFDSPLLKHCRSTGMILLQWFRWIFSQEWTDFFFLLYIFQAYIYYNECSLMMGVMSTL